MCSVMTRPETFNLTVKKCIYIFLSHLFKLLDLNTYAVLCTLFTRTSVALKLWISFDFITSAFLSPASRSLRCPATQRGLRIQSRPLGGTDSSGLSPGFVRLQWLEFPQLRHRGGRRATQVWHISL